MKRNPFLYILIFAGLVILGVFLLRSEFLIFFRWYLVMLLMGIGFLPLTLAFFDTFEDRGWLFSKTISIGVCGYITWLFVTSGLQQFTSRRCIVITLIVFGITWVRYLGKKQRSKIRLDVILFEEVIFFAVMLGWTYLFCFKPEAYGTEKFMDYGLLVSMERSLKLPAKDMWYGMADVNYYYGGQYYTAYLAKLIHVPARYAYNLMRAATAAFAFTMPFSIVYHMLRVKLGEKRHAEGWSLAGGVTAGTAVSLAGNLHYVLYGLFGKVFRLDGYEIYWFPSSTRYIGHNPEILGDQCIHEFPSYSFVLGDLHAHMVNIIFVLTILGLLYCWVRRVRMLELDRLERERIRQEQQLHRPSKFKGEKSWKIFLKRNAVEGPLLLAGAFIGLCKFTNYWDFIIYFTVATVITLLVALYRYSDHTGRAVASVLLHMAEVWVFAELVPLPFMLRFDPPVSGVGISAFHTQPYQLAILWGLPAAAALLLVLTAVREHRGREGSFFRNAPQSDRFAIALAFCAAGLVVLPELVYVKDIYENGFSRANTMFKLSYQAYILFAIVMGYALIRLLADARLFAVQILSGILLCVFALTVGYLPYSISCWFGDVANRDRFKGLDATEFIERVYPEDAGAIDWLRTYVTDQPIVLEASGNSYSDYCRVSAMTGLPTLEGWYVHEWLWRGDTTDLDAKNNEIQKIYEAEDPDIAELLMTRYGISYLFVGSLEHEKYDIDDEVLMQTGELVYQEGNTYIIHFRTVEEDGSV